MQPFLNDIDKSLILSIDLFKELTPTDIDLVLHNITIRELPKGTPLIVMGDEAESMYVIIEGSIEVYITKPTGEYLVLSILKQGNVIGEDALAVGSNGRRTANAITIEKVRVAEIPAHIIHVLSEKNSYIKEKLSNHFIMHTYDRMLKLMTNLSDIRITTEDSQYIRQINYQPNDVIFSTGEDGDAIYFVLQGCVRVIKKEGNKEKVIAKLSQGQCFGEIALLENTKRTATIIADEVTTLIRIDKTLFLQWHASHSMFRDLMKSLRHVYYLQDESLVTTHFGQYEGKDCISTIRQQKSGSSFYSVKILGEETIVFYKMIKTLTQANIEIKNVKYSSPTEPIKRELQFLDKKIIGVMATGSWPNLREIIRMIIDEEEVPSWKEKLFQERGEIELEYASELISDNTLVCKCMRVSYSDLCHAVNQFGTNEADLIALTGATLICGCCKSLMDELLGKTDFIDVHIKEVKKVSTDDWLVTLRSLKNILPSYQPGQYINLQTRIDDKWIQRSFTLTNQQDQYTWEIIVQRQLFGIMSNWLTGQHHQDVILRASPPQGSFVISSSLKPVVFFAAGIGITPALSILRANIPGIFVHYSESNPDDFLFKDELNKLPNVHLHCTSREGRLSEQHITTIMQQYPDADVMICGPNAYANMIVATLEKLSVAKSRIKIESFLPDEQIKRPNFLCKENHRIKPVFIDEVKDLNNEVAQFLNDIYADFGSLDVYKTRLKAAETEIKQYNKFTLLADEINISIRKNLLKNNINITNLYILDRRYLTSQNDVSIILKDHDYYALSSNANIVLTIVADHVEFPSNRPTITVALTKYCQLRMLMTAPNEIKSDHFKYTFDVIPSKKPPLSFLGVHNIPIVGIYYRLKDIITKPIELVARSRKKYGDIFTIRIPFNFDLTYIDRKSFDTVLELPKEIAQIGYVMMNIPTVGFWFKRSQIADDLRLQSLVVSCRQFIADHLVHTDNLVAMPSVIKKVVKEHTKNWGEKINLADSLVKLIYDASISCLIGGQFWEDMKQEVIPLFRIIANGVDITHAAAAKASPFKHKMPEYVATKKLEKIFDDLVDRHHQHNIYPFLDKLAMMQVDELALPKEDVSWVLMYLIWNGVTYPGSYGLWAFTHILSHAKIYTELQKRNFEQKQLLLTSCLIETIRLNPVSSLVRKLGCPIDYMNGNKKYRIEKDSILGVFPYEICHDSKVHANPEEFNPHRYSSGEKIPELFGRGPFGCVAMQYSRVLISTIFSELLENYDFNLLSTLPPRSSRVHLLYPHEPIWSSFSSKKETHLV